MQNVKVHAEKIKKAGRMLHSIGLQLPRENTFTNFNNSIVYFIQNVKAYAEKIAEILREKSTDRKSKKLIECFILPGYNCP